MPQTDADASDPETTAETPREARAAKADRLRELSSRWLREPDTAMFCATIHEYGGEAVEVRLPKSVAVTALEDAIRGLC